MRAVSSTDVPGAFIHLTISALQPFPDRTSNRPRSASLCQGLQYIALYSYISKSCTTHLRKHITLKIVTPEALEGDLKVLRPLRTIKTSYSGSQVACSADAWRFPSRAVYLNVPCTLSSPSLSRHSGGYFLTVKQILKHLSLDLDFLTKVIHTGESNRVPERIGTSILQRSRCRFLSKHTHRYQGQKYTIRDDPAVSMSGSRVNFRRPLGWKGGYLEC